MLDQYEEVARQESGWQVIKNVKDIENRIRHISAALVTLDDTDSNTSLDKKPNQATRKLLTDNLMQSRQTQVDVMTELLAFNYPEPDFNKLNGIRSQQKHFSHPLLDYY